MRDSFPVGLIQGVSHLDADVHDFSYRERAAPDFVGQGLPFDILHGNGSGTDPISDFVDGGDVGVLQAGEAALASRMNRRIRSGSEASSVGRIFRAIVRSSRGSWAR